MQAALKKEKDEGSRERLKKLEKDLANLKDQSKKLKAQWQNEKAAIDAGLTLADLVRKTLALKFLRDRSAL